MRSASPIVTPLLAAGLLTLSGCGRDPATRALKQELDDLKDSYATAQEELQQLRDSQSASIAREESLQASLKEAQITSGKLEIQKQNLEQKFDQQESRLQSILEEVEAAHEKHRAEMDALRADFEEYKRKFRISLRLRAPGTELPDLEYLGKNFTNPVVVFATPAWLEIRHDGGMANLDFAFLPLSLRERFGYHPDEASQFAKLQKESKADTLVNHLAAKDQEANFERQRQLRIIHVAWQNKLARADAQIARKESEIRAVRHQLQGTSSRSSGAARLRNDIERLSRDLEFLKRDRHLVTLEEPPNPDAH